MLWARHRAPGSPSWACFPGRNPLKIPIDSNGNLTTKTEGTDNWTYEWDAENQLKRVTRNGAEVARFAYDPLGRRVEKTEGSVTTGYLHDGTDLIREVRGASLVKYVHGPNVDEPLAVEHDASASWFHADALGSIVKTTNASGAITLLRQYDSWGDLEVGASESGFAFTGREWDAVVLGCTTTGRDSDMGRPVKSNKPCRCCLLHLDRLVE